MKNKLTQEEEKYLKEVEEQLNEYEVSQKPHIYNVPIENLSYKTENEIHINHSEYSELIERIPEYTNKVELDQNIEFIFSEDHWKWKKHIQQKVYLALLNEIKFTLELRPLLKLRILEKCPDPRLAKAEEHKRANLSYGEWFANTYTNTYRNQNSFEIDTNEYLLTRMNDFPLNFWQNAMDKHHTGIQFELRLMIANPQTLEQKLLSESINQLCNYKFVIDHFKNKTIDPINKQKIDALSMQSKFNQREHTLLIYYLAKLTDKYPTLKDIDTGKASKEKMIEFHKEQKGLIAGTPSTFRNYFCEMSNPKKRGRIINQPILDELKGFPKALTTAKNDKIQFEKNESKS